MSLSRRRILALAALAVAGGVHASAAWAQQNIEYAVKATFLLRFGDFVEWPAAAFAPSDPLNICVLGPDPFGALLTDAVAGQKVQGREVRIVSVVDGLPPPRCHIAYTQNVGIAQERLSALRALPVLTVVDTADARGGIINFVIDRNRVRFAIDPHAASESGLSISSKLLSLAVNLKR